MRENAGICCEFAYALARKRLAARPSASRKHENRSSALALSGLGEGGLFARGRAPNESGLLDDFAALVEATGRAGAVRHARLAAVAASSEVRDDHLVVVGTAHIALGTAGAALRNSHGLPLGGRCVQALEPGLTDRRAAKRGSIGRSASLSTKGGRSIPGHDSEHKGIMGISSTRASRTTSSSTKCSPS